jgi:hypothetical protein
LKHPNDVEKWHARGVHEHDIEASDYLRVSDLYEELRACIEGFVVLLESLLGSFRIAATRLI